MALITGWMFTLPAMANTFFGTRGLAFGGGPFKASLANGSHLPAGLATGACVHIVFAIAVVGVVRVFAIARRWRPLVGVSSPVAAGRSRRHTPN